MLVPQLEKLSLSTIKSGDSGNNVDISRAHALLRECAEEMSAKYKKKQASTPKRRVKARAVNILLTELSKVPKDSLATRETILSALKLHAEALQGHEHLLSKKGNTYALIEKTQALGLREGHDDVSASLLRYHRLKNRLLGSDSPLNSEQGKIISELDEKKDLTLKTLEALEAYPRIPVKLLLILHKAGLLEPQLCAKVLEHENPDRAVKALVELDKADLLKSNWCDMVLKDENPDDTAEVFVKLIPRKLDTPGNCAEALKHEDLDDIIKASTAVLTRSTCSMAEKSELLYELLARKMADDIPGYRAALQNGDTETIAAFIKKGAAIIAALPMDKGQKADLLYRFLVGKTADGIPGLFMTLEKGHPDAIAVFIKTSAEVITALSLSEKLETDLLYRLLSSLTADDRPGFYMTFHNEHPDAIAVFLKESMAVIAKLPLPDKHKTELQLRLLASKSNKSPQGGSGQPVFLMALQEGHPQAITAFIQTLAAVIKDLNLPQADKAELLYQLLANKIAGGPLGFHMVFQSGNPEATTAFIQACATAMVTFFGSEEDSAAPLYKLLKSIKNDSKQDFVITLNRGGPAANKAFNYAIGQLPLSTKQKETLRNPTPDIVENMDMPQTQK